MVNTMQVHVWTIRQQRFSIGMLPTVATLLAMPSRLKKPSNAIVMIPSSSKSNSSVEKFVTSPWAKPAPAAASPPTR